MIQEQKLQKCLIGFDMGNTSIRVYHGNKEIIFYNSMMIENTSIYINKKPSVSCLNDSTLLLGIKHQDPKFMQIAKYYNYTFKKGNNRSLIVKFHHKTIPDEFYIEYTIFLMIKGIFKTHPNLKYLMMTQNNLKMVVTIFQGELNSYRLSLKEIFKRCGINEISFTSTNNCIVTAYLKNIKKRQNRDYSEVVGVIDFSDKGMTFMIYKIYSTPIGLIEVLSNSFTYIGGNMLTNLIVDYVVKQLIVKKGMDISKVPKFMHKLKLLCNQAKHVLSTNEMAYVRLDNLPDILVFGCQITESQFQKCIQKDIKTNVDMIKQSIQKCNQKINKIILHGGSCKIPYFKKLIKKQLGSMKFIDSDKQWLGQGLLQIKSGRYHVIDVTNLNLRMQGDQKFACKIMQSNEQLPLRKHIPMRFPSGELTFSMRFYQNNVLVCTCFIPERPRQNKYNLYIQVDKNKMLTIYATTSHGLIKMNSNMMQIGSPQFLKHEEQTKEYDFHNQND